METITLKGNPIHTEGPTLKPGDKAPDFTLTTRDLEDKSLADFPQKRLVLNIFPSIDTSVCAQSVRRFNQEAAARKDTAVLCISRDLPFAHQRFCAAEGLEDVITLSAMRNAAFGKDYGLTITNGPLASLFSRVVIILDENRKVLYAEQVPEIGQEPDYPAALKALESL